MLDPDLVATRMVRACEANGATVNANLRADARGLVVCLLDYLSLEVIDQCVTAARSLGLQPNHPEDYESAVFWPRIKGTRRNSRGR
jgi:hypothetical protein